MRPAHQAREVIDPLGSLRGSLQRFNEARASSAGSMVSGMRLFSGGDRFNEARASSAGSSPSGGGPH